MAKDIGRNFILSKGETPIAGVRTTGLTVNNETIDFTDQNSDGWQELSSAVGQRNVEISISGIYVDDDLLDTSIDENIQGEFTLTSVGAGRTLTGDFNVTNYSESGEHEGEKTFECTLESSGEVIKGNVN